MDKLSIEDFKSAKEALLKANVPEAHFVVCAPIPYEDQHGIKELRQKQIDIVSGKNYSLGTLPDSNKKENTMFHTQDCFDIPAPSSYKSKTLATSVGPISMALNMPPQQDPTQKGKEHLIRRADQAMNDKEFALRQAYNLIEDDTPDTLKDFIQRIKDGKFITELTEKEQAERKFWSTERMLEEILWQDPARKPDEAGFNAASKTLRQSYLDTADEIIVKAPEAGLEALRAFQAKTFN
jgi:hypothetical protein